MPANPLMGASLPDLSAVGNAARISKGATAAPKTLTSVTISKGDDGGVVVRSVYTGGKPTERVYSPDEAADAASNIKGLLSDMGVAPDAPAEAAGVAGPLGSLSGMRGPGGGATAQVTGPRGNTLRGVAPPDDEEL